MSTIQKIGDFGLATAISNKEHAHTTMCGTANFIAPFVWCDVM